MSSSSSESDSSPAPSKKRKQDESESSGNDDDDGDVHDSDTSNSDEEDSEAPQLPPVIDDNEPALSHAERRRQKKKQKQLAAAATDSSSSSPRKKIKLADGSAAAPTTPTENPNSKTKSKAKVTSEDPSRQKRQNSVWVGNLSFRTTPDALRAFFEGSGEITRIHMPMRPGRPQQGENMGFAYVDFATPDAKVVAITLSEGHLNGRKLLIKDGNDFTGRPAKPSASEGAAGEGQEDPATKISADGTTRSKIAQKILRNQKQPPAPTLFLGNLGFETTEASIRELFEAHRYSRHKDKDIGNGVEQEGGKEEEGEKKPKDKWIRKIRMGTFEDSGNCKGFAFVDFTSIEHATEALANPRNHRLDGRGLVVEYASADAVRRGGGGPRNPKQDRKSLSGTGRTLQKASDGSSYPPKRRSQPVKQDGEDAIEAQAETPSYMPRSQRPDHGSQDRSHGRRARPGAALAQAQRQSAAIIPGQGQKIVF